MTELVLIAMIGLAFILGWLTRALRERKIRESTVATALRLEREASAQHRANRLLDNGRVTDVHPDATGAPSRQGQMRWIGTRPESPDRPRTRM